MMVAPVFIPTPIVTRGYGGPPPPAWLLVVFGVLMVLVYLAILAMTYDVTFSRANRYYSSVTERIVGYLLFAAVASPLVVAPVAWWWLR